MQSEWMVLFAGVSLGGGVSFAVGIWMGLRLSERAQAKAVDVMRIDSWNKKNAAAASQQQQSTNRWQRNGQAPSAANGSKAARAVNGDTIQLTAE